jgi:hypothetical protein
MPHLPNRDVAAFSDEDLTLWFSLLDDIRYGTQSSGLGRPRLGHRPRELTDPDAAPCVLARNRCKKRGANTERCPHVPRCLFPVNTDED